MCEDDPDKAECIREVEEAKANPGINDVQQEGKIRALVPYFVNVSVKFRRCNSSRKQAFYASLGCAQQILKISSSGDKAQVFMNQRLLEFRPGKKKSFKLTFRVLFALTLVEILSFSPEQSNR